MPDIVLATLNAKYIHASFGLRYLLANLGPLRARGRVAEFDINQRPLEIAESLLAQGPIIIGFGVYIWNVAETAEVIAILKRVRPEIIIILGGPEVSYEIDQQVIVQLADYIITGEADLKFAEVCGQILSGQPPKGKEIPAGLPDFGQLKLPYELYNEQDIAHRVIYVEASRGCPFSCEFCLSSLDIPVRQVPLEKLLPELQQLLDRGVKHFKFVDRTFNLNLGTSRALLQFFLERYQPGHFFHFEMIPDRLPEALREIISKFPAGALQFEVGIQSFNEEVCRLISRRQDTGKLEDNLRFLRERTGVHVHADLIFGLPGEPLESFAAGFDRLVGLKPQEIQVGILKRLRGTPIKRHDDEWQMVYHSHPPYEVLQNKLIDFGTVQKMHRFARFWDLIGNSGNFTETTPLLWAANEALPETSKDLDEGLHCSLSPGERVRVRGSASLPTNSGAATSAGSPFWSFIRWSEWAYAQLGRTDSIALVRLTELLFRFLTEELKLAPQSTAEILWRDYRCGGRRETPQFLRPYVQESEVRRNALKSSVPLKRQARHMANI
jgi:radical SAM superfamily enzyme YgiQ (UPF0313 family)